MAKIFGHCPWSPTWTEGLHTLGCGLVSQGDCYNTAITTPVPCSLQHETFHLGLGRSEPHWPACVVATLIRVCPPQLLTPPMWPRVKVRIYDTLSYGRGFGFMGGFNGIYNHNEFWNESKKCAKQFIIPKRNSWTGREWGFLNQDIHYSNFNWWLYCPECVNVLTGMLTSVENTWRNTTSSSVTRTGNTLKCKHCLNNV
jgi:hypothetical protein